jgi:hypothetical protein
MNFGGVNGELLRDVASISILKNSVPFRNDKECIFGVRVAYRNPDKQPAFIGDGQCRNVREMTISGRAWGRTNYPNPQAFC